MNSDQKMIQQTDCWLKTVVIQENLCPFAAAVVHKQQLRYSVSHATQRHGLQADILTELRYLVTTPAETVATTLFIIADMFDDFFDFNEQLNWIEDLLDEHNLVGEIQIATFHPYYQFAGSSADDASNYSNRSPYPMLHFIREVQLEEAIAHYPNPELIPQRNIQHLTELGLEQLQNRLNHCLKLK